MKDSSSITELMTWWDELSATVHVGEVESKFMKRIKALKRKRAPKSKKRDFIRVCIISEYFEKKNFLKLTKFKKNLDSRYCQIPLQTSNVTDSSFSRT